jgi:hypothetical protein
MKGGAGRNSSSYKISMGYDDACKSSPRDSISFLNARNRDFGEKNTL